MGYSGSILVLGFEQKLTFTNGSGDLVIADIHVRDYPILIKLLNATAT